MASAIVRLLVTVVMLGVCAVGWTEAAPQVNHWHDATNALYPIDYLQTLCERDCPGEPSFMCDFYECDEEDENANEVDNDFHEESEEEYYDEEDEMEDHYTDLVHEVFDCRSNETLTCTTASTTPTTTVRVNEIVSLPVEVGKRRKLSARQLNRLLKSGASRDEIYRLLEQYMVPRVRKNPNGASKRDLAHRKSEYREERDCAIRPWLRRRAADINSNSAFCILMLCGNAHRFVPPDTRAKEVID
uniref:Uncharacterized protein n=1 Tax=Anopheles merus TaxID=30066 RepID=A0A182UMN0_ANOME